MAVANNSANTATYGKGSRAPYGKGLTVGEVTRGASADKNAQQSHGAASVPPGNVDLHRDFRDGGRPQLGQPIEGREVLA